MRIEGTKQKRYMKVCTTPLYLAITWDYKNVAELLKKYGAK